MDQRPTRPSAPPVASTRPSGSSLADTRVVAVSLVRTSETRMTPIGTFSQKSTATRYPAPTALPTIGPSRHRQPGDGTEDADGRCPALRGDLRRSSANASGRTSACWRWTAGRAISARRRRQCAGGGSGGEQPHADGEHRCPSRWPSAGAVVVVRRRSACRRSPSDSSAAAMRAGARITGSAVATTWVSSDTMKDAADVTASTRCSGVRRSPSLTFLLQRLPSGYRHPAARSCSMTFRRDRCRYRGDEHRHHAGAASARETLRPSPN